MTAALAGCLGGGGGDADVMVGVLQPLSGDLGDLGTLIRDAAVLPQSQIEDDVDISIDIREEDTESTDEAGISAAESLANAGYPAVTGAASSSVTQAVADNVFIPQDVVGISPASTTPQLTDLEDDGFVNRTCPSDVRQGDVMAQAATDRGISTAATFHLNNEYGELLSESFTNSFEERDGTVQREVSFEGESPPYTSGLETALQDDPDLLVVIGYPASGTDIFRNYYANFDDGRTVMVTDGLRSTDLPGNVDNPMQNVIGTAPEAAGPAVDTFSQLYQDEYDSQPGVFNAQAYDATAVLILAGVAADSTDGPAVRDQIRNVANPDGTEVGPDNLADAVTMVQDGEAVNYQGASSPVTFDDNGDITAGAYGIWEFGDDGSIEQIDTVSFGE